MCRLFTTNPVKQALWATSGRADTQKGGFAARSCNHSVGADKFWSIEIDFQICWGLLWVCQARSFKLLSNHILVSYCWWSGCFRHGSCSEKYHILGEFLLVEISLREQFICDSMSLNSSYNAQVQGEGSCATCDRSFIVLFADGQAQKLFCCLILNFGSLLPLCNLY